ncbi:NPCBM/NEW2 domain-containing protein [Streptomyces tubercidicus]|uniref:NPCBM/NEW2 domain-containing protein n=1 Tax=Streptomyces tubercidicus TaxID=47759 RepID=UPI003682E173
MQEHSDTLGGSRPSDTELVQRIRAAARTGGRAAAGQYGAQAPDGTTGAAEEALHEFHRRHYAAVLAQARDCCRSSQAAADLTKQAIDAVLRSPGPAAGSDADWRKTLLTAVRDTAAAWHRTSRDTELRDDFPSWLAARMEGERPPPADGERASPGRAFAPAGPPMPPPSAAPLPTKGSPLSPARLAVLASAVAVAVLAGVAISAGSRAGSAHHDTSAESPEHSYFPSAPPPDRSASADPKGSSPASRSAPGSPDPTHSKASKSPKPRHPSSAKPSRSSRPGGKTKPPAGQTTALTTRMWTSSSSTFSPARQNTSIDGHPLTIHGTGYAQGLGAHANSEITYHLGGTCTALTVDVGLDDEVAANGSVVFQVYRDSTLVADSGLMTVGQPAKRLTADLTGGTDLRLVVTDGGNGNDSDHADWGGPAITCH